MSKRFNLLSDESFYNYSFLNSILILKQKAFICLSYSKWKEKERYVKKGANAIKIYVPMKSKNYTCKDCKKTFYNKVEVEKHAKSKNLNINKDFQIYDNVSFKIGNVFDVSDTEGKDLNFHYEENSDNETVFNYEILRDILSKEFNFVVNEIISKSHGHVLQNDPNNIFISEASNNADKMIVLIHELTHLILHVRSGKTSNMDKDVKEVEAEAVAYIIASFLNLEISFSEFYIKSFANDEIIKKIDFNSVCKFAGKLLNILNKNLVNLSKTA